MGRALNATGRKIFYSVEGWTPDPLKDNDWAREVANMWRTGQDIWPYWDGGLPNHAILFNLYTTNYAAPFHIVGGGTNDPDMLLPPNTLIGVSKPGLAPEEAQSQFVLWAVMKAPLSLGIHYTQLANLKQLDPSYYALLTNAELIGIDQDLSPQATLRAQMPSQAQQTGANASEGLQITLQKCDATRADQRFIPKAAVGEVRQIALAESSLCLTDDSSAAAAGNRVLAKPCAAADDAAASGQSWSLQRDVSLAIAKSQNSSMCLSSSGGTLSFIAQPTMKQCVYDGPLPPPLSVANEHAFGTQLYIWGEYNNQIVAGGTGSCLTVGLPNYTPGQTTWVNNSGTLEHEVWMGDLTANEKTGKARRVVVLFNKGRFTETVTAAAALIGTSNAQGVTAVRDIIAKKDMPPLVKGGALSAVVPSHGVAAFVLER